MSWDPNAKSMRKCPEISYEIQLKTFASIIALLTLVTVLVSTIFVARQDSLQRYSITGTPDKVVGGAGEANGRMEGMFFLDSNDNIMGFEFRTYLSNVTAIHLRGPVPLGSRTGPLAAVLCGGPGAGPACNTVDWREIPRTHVPKVYDGVAVVPGDVRTLIQKIRPNPTLFYVEVLTVTVPTSPGAVRSELGGILGTP